MKLYVSNIEESYKDQIIGHIVKSVTAALIKCSKYRFNQKILHDTKQRIQEIAINNGWNTHIVQILHEKSDANLFSKEIVYVDYPNLLAYHTIESIRISSIRSQSLIYIFDESESGPFEVPSGLTETNYQNKSLPYATKLYVLQ